MNHFVYFLTIYLNFWGNFYGNTKSSLVLIHTHQKKKSRILYRSPNITARIGIFLENDFWPHPSYQFCTWILQKVSQHNLTRGRSARPRNCLNLTSLFQTFYWNNKGTDLRKICNNDKKCKNIHLYINIQNASCSLLSN